MAKIEWKFYANNHVVSCCGRWGLLPYHPVVATKPVTYMVHDNHNPYKRYEELEPLLTAQKHAQQIVDREEGTTVKAQNRYRRLKIMMKTIAVIAIPLAIGGYLGFRHGRKKV